MQVFYVDEEPHKAAQFLCDSHVRKQTTESGQILSTAIRTLLKNNPVDFGNLCKSYNPNHPIMKWAGYSFENFHWLYHHYLALLQEFGFRTGKVHGSIQRLNDIRKFYYFLAQHKNTLFAHKEFKEPLCIKYEDCIIEDDSVESYRTYYRKHKLRFAKWTEREIPEWIYE